MREHASVNATLASFRKIQPDTPYATKIKWDIENVRNFFHSRGCSLSPSVSSRK